MSLPLLVSTGDPAGVGPIVSVRAAERVGASGLRGTVQGFAEGYAGTWAERRAAAQQQLDTEVECRQRGGLICDVCDTREQLQQHI